MRVQEEVTETPKRTRRKKVADGEATAPAPRQAKAQEAPASEPEEESISKRGETTIVRNFLAGLEYRASRRSSPEVLQRRLTKVEERLADETDPLQRLLLVQERADLTKAVADLASEEDWGSIEEAFVKVAKAYAERKGIAYETWREVGVPPDVLRRAGYAVKGRAPGR